MKINANKGEWRSVATVPADPALTLRHSNAPLDSLAFAGIRPDPAGDSVLNGKNKKFKRAIYISQLDAFK